MTTEGTPTPPKASPPMPTRWFFTMEAVGQGPPAVVRVRRLLKAAWRCYGLKCVVVPSGPSDHATGDGGPLAANVATEKDVMP